MAAATNNITIPRGSDFTFTLLVKDASAVIVDLSLGTAADFAMQIRRGEGKPLIASATTSFVTDGTDGLVLFTIPESETLKLNSRHRYKYDIFWENSSSEKDQLITGDVTVAERITITA